MMVAVLWVPETYSQSSCDEKHSSEFCKSLLVICQKWTAAQARSVLPRGCPGRKALCARGFLLSTQTGQAFSEGGQNDSCPARKKLGPISWKKQEWRQSLIHSVLIFLEKVLLKALAVNSDSVTCQCLSCPFLLAPFPKCSYCTFRDYKPTLPTCSFSNTFQTISPSL